MSDGAQNIGYAMLPVALSFENITRDIADKLGMPLKSAASRAGTDAGAAIAAGLEQAKGKVESAASKVAGAYKKIEDQTGKLRVAEAQLQSLRDRGITDAGRLAAAEEKVARAQRDLTDAEKAHENAQRASTRARDDLTRAQRDANRAQSQGIDSAGRLGAGLRNVGTHANGAARGLAAMAAKGAGLAAAAAGVASVGSFFSDSVKSLQRIERINTQTATVIQSTGAAAGVTAKHVEDLAGSMENLTATEAETVQEGANFLLTFKNIRNEAGAGNDIFDQTTRAMVDLSRATGTDMKAASLQLGKALNDPMKGLTALSRVGITFSAEQKNMIESLTTTGDVMGAQKIILKELESQFGGSAEAYAKTTEGRVELAKHAVGTLGESITATVLPVLGQFATVAANALNGLAEKWPSIVENVKGYVEPFVGTLRDIWATVLPSVRTAFETVLPVVQSFLQGAFEWASTTGLPALKTGFELAVTAISGFSDVVSGVASFISDNREAFIAVAGTITALFLPALIAAGATMAANAITVGVIGGAMKVYTVSTKLAAGATKAFAIAQHLLKAAFIGNPIGLLIAGLVALGAGLVLAYKKSETFRNIVTGAWNAIKGAAGAVVSWFTDTAWPWLQRVWDGISDGVGTMIGFVRDHWRTIVSVIGGPIGLVVALVTKYWDQIKGAFSAAWDGIKVIVDAGLAVFRGIGTVLEWLWQNVFVRVWDGIKAAIGFAWDGIKLYVDAGLAVFRGIGAVLEWLWQNVVVRVWDGIKNAIANAWGLIQPVIGAFRAGVEIAGDVISGVWNGLVDTVTSVGTGIRDGFMAVVNFVGGLPGKIADKARGMWDGIKNAFKAAVNWIIDGWNRIEFKIPGFKMGPVKFDGFTLGLPDIPRLAGGGRISDLFKRAVGIVRGPGGPTDDQVPSLLSNRESVNTAASTSKYWPLFEKLNRGVPLHKALFGLVPAFSTGGVAGREPYGLPAGSSGSVDVPWVQDIERQFGVEARTYAGHQEKDGLNKGIDWFGPTSNMQRLAEHLRSIRGDLEQVIWLNPETGEKIGVADGELVGPGTSQPGYYANDWADHTDHVHTRQSYSFAGTTPQSSQPVIYDSTTGTEGGSSDSQPPTAPAAMSLGEWIGRRIFGNWDGAAAASGASTSGSSSAPTSSSPASSAGGSSLSSAASSAGSSSLGAAATAAGTSSAPPKLTRSSNRDEIARAIYLEARRRGYSHDEAVAFVATGLQESGLDPEADGGDQGIGGAWGIFQQGAHYGPDRKDPNVAMAGFFDRMERTGGSKSDRDIWEQIVGIQQHDGEFAGTAGDSKYMGEIKSQLDTANKLVGGLENATDPGSSSSSSGVSPTAPTSAGGVDPKKLREAKDKADDAENAAAVARTKLAEIESNPKAKESAKQAARDKLAKLERDAKQAKDDLAALEQTGANAPASTTTGGSSTGSGDKPQIIVVLDGQNVDASELTDLTKILAGGVLETFGLDGSWLPNPSELGIVKMTNALLGIKFTEPAWMSGQGEPPPWIDKGSIPFSTKPMAPQADPRTTPGGMAAGALGLDGIGALVGSMPQRNVDASININNPQGDPNDIAKRVRRLLPDQRTRLHGAVPVGR
ncbi:tape measure protein [Gordonia phage BetterKatz]|uniref:Tape measure protein n=1 Tax=Gordonia phage BetterKatz TaxID=1821551 RepID=A0A142KC22_9CAUD|nr:tail length tape measure protein [Gordonia phage BetterKatz]AMS03655.1 tape measure protein [Gordonia phage BetterKatz]